MISWLPIQVGAPTEFARSHRSTLMFLLMAQCAVFVVRVFYLFQFAGGLLNAMAVVLGVCAWRQEMNITYVCFWGLVSLVCFAVDIGSVLMGLIVASIHVFSEELGVELAVRLVISVLDCVACLVALLLYRDWHSQEPLYASVLEKGIEAHEKGDLQLDSLYGWFTGALTDTGDRDEAKPLVGDKGSKSHVWSGASGSIVDAAGGTHSDDGKGNPFSTEKRDGKPLPAPVRVDNNPFLTHT